MNTAAPQSQYASFFNKFLGGKLQTQSLRTEFNRTLCKTYEGKRVNETGFDTWSTHRLRHTMASKLASAGADAATVMAAGGWKNCNVMSGYARVDANTVRHGYDKAMRQAQDQKEFARCKKVLSPADLLARQQMRASPIMPRHENAL
jgi:integrase/recombinase XerC